MGGSILLAVLAVQSVGGLGPLTEQTAAHFGSTEAAFGVIPPLNAPWLPVTTIFVWLGVQWWAAWYPGQEPGGGGYVVQRILSAKDERHGLLATLWFTIAHYALRPWPWILVGFVGLLRYPGLANPEEGYVRVMVDILPSPFKGLLLAAFAAAYMSTISTHLNWGASYLVNDVFIRFIRPNASPRAQVRASRLATAFLMVASLVVMGFLTSVEQGWKLLIGLGAGTGLVFILRWYWWRVNAWSEISAMVASFVTSLVLTRFGHSTGDPGTRDYAVTMITTVGITTVVWLAVTLLTAPESDQTLDRFYRRVRPGGPGWRQVAQRLGFGQDRIPGGSLSWVNWVAGIAAVYTAVFAVGAALTGTPLTGLIYGLVAMAAFLLIQRNLRADEQLAASVDTALDPRLHLDQKNEVHR
jgi:SSS family solute:Na+ symporter